MSCTFHYSHLSARDYITFEKQNNISFHVLICSIKVGGHGVWPQAIDQADAYLSEVRMFAPHKPGPEENTAKTQLQ